MDCGYALPLLLILGLLFCFCLSCGTVILYPHSPPLSTILIVPLAQEISYRPATPVLAEFGRRMSQPRLYSWRLRTSRSFPGDIPMRISILLSGALLLPSGLFAQNLLVANQGDHTLLVVDPATRKAIAKVGVDINGHEVTASPDGKYAYVPIYGKIGRAHV